MVGGTPRPTKAVPLRGGPRGLRSRSGLQPEPGRRAQPPFLACLGGGALSLWRVYFIVAVPRRALLQARPKVPCARRTARSGPVSQDRRTPCPRAAVRLVHVMGSRI